MSKETELPRKMDNYLIWANSNKKEKDHQQETYSAASPQEFQSDKTPRDRKWIRWNWCRHRRYNQKVWTYGPQRENPAQESRSELTWDSRVEKSPNLQAERLLELFLINHTIIRNAWTDAFEVAIQILDLLDCDCKKGMVSLQLRLLRVQKVKLWSRNENNNHCESPVQPLCIYVSLSQYCRGRQRQRTLPAKQTHSGSSCAILRAPSFSILLNLSHPSWRCQILRIKGKCESTNGAILREEKRSQELGMDWRKFALFFGLLPVLGVRGCHYLAIGAEVRRTM